MYFSGQDRGQNPGAKRGKVKSSQGKHILGAGHWGKEIASQLESVSVYVFFKKGYGFCHFCYYFCPKTKFDFFSDSEKPFFDGKVFEEY